MIADDTGSRRLRNPFISSPPSAPRSPTDPAPGGAAGASPSGPDLSGPPGAAGASTPTGGNAQQRIPTFGRQVVDVDGTPVVVAEMAEFDFADAPQEPHRLTFKPRAQSDGHWHVTISWPAWSGADEVAVYRVIAADGGPPESVADNPEATLDVTTATSIVDSSKANPPEAGVRYYEVWLHTGRTVADAVASPPFFYAGVSPHDRFLWPPLGLAVTPSGRDLVVSWDALPDQRFRLGRRTRAEAARRSRPATTECEDVPSRGYLDADVPAGQPYVYYLYSGVPVGQVIEWSAVPAATKAEVPVSLESVLDLTVEPRGESRVDLLWTTVPTGKVEIYTTSKAPPTDLDTAGQVSRESLREYPFGLDLDSRMTHPVAHEDDGHSRMANVDVSSDAAAVYFIPITVHGQQARPGKPLRWLRAEPPSNLVVVDRVQQVLLAFRWPRGAARVDLWRTAAEARPTIDTAHPTQSLSREDYDTFGGFLIDRERSLIPSGAHGLHLAGYVSHAGIGKHSTIASIQAQFPALVRYTFDLEQRQALRGPKLRRRLTVSSFESVRDVTFALVWSAHQLPLSSEDGQVVHTATVNLPARQPVEIEGLPELAEYGYVRLVADRFHEPAIALLDPPPAQLRLRRG
jgi:hypothetical protein